MRIKEDIVGVVVARLRTMEEVTADKAPKAAGLGNSVASTEQEKGEYTPKG